MVRPAPHTLSSLINLTDKNVLNQLFPYLNDKELDEFATYYFFFYWERKMSILCGISLVYEKIGKEINMQPFLTIFIYHELNVNFEHV